MSDKQTPLMKQFWDIKNQHLDKILLFRMGDFYEMFHDDAIKAAPILNIALTSRNKKAEDETPMCGVPHHSIATPISKLLAAGLKVAICDQLENPEEAKGIVKRGVTRILSPGMVYDPENILESSSHYLAAYDDETVSFLEATTGECFYYSIKNNQQALALIKTISVAEVLLTADQMQQQLLNLYCTEFSELETEWPERFAQAPESAKRLLTYATRMQGPKVLATLKEFEPRNLKTKMVLSTNVIKHLEIFNSYRNEEKGSLFQAIRRTKTSAGARLLKNWLQFPLTNLVDINHRLDQVELWTKKPADLKILRQTFARMGDVERRLAKISYSNCHVWDFISLLNSIKVGEAISPLCLNVTDFEITALQKVISRIEKTIVEDPPVNMKSGGYIKSGVLPELDELIELAENSQKLLFDLEMREKEQTQISSLKIRYNNVFGYYIEITNVHKNKVPDHYKRKQTLANAERYVTQELNELEGKILSSRERRVQVEEKLLADLKDFVLGQGALLLNVAQKWSELDVQTSFAWLALEQKYCRPQFSKNDELRLEGSRHPVVEQEVQKVFVPNDISLSSGECLLLTGPNMAGKSTLMRQVAVTAIMAQAGAFVPAKKAVLPIFSQLFTRIGASDSLSEGLSTFMVEMKETSEMLLSANNKTLVVLDEVGRGTSTYDGMSLAQAILEFLITQTKCMTLFATHYHELTDLSQTYAQIHNAHMSINEKNHEIKFQYALKKGPASKSYGIQVAELAGLPKSVVSRAAQILKIHENSVYKQLSLTSLSQTTEQNHEIEEFVQKVKNFNIQDKSPLEALNQISKWQQELS